MDETLFRNANENKIIRTATKTHCQSVNMRRNSSNPNAVESR